MTHETTVEWNKQLSLVFVVLVLQSFVVVVAVVAVVVVVVDVATHHLPNFFFKTFFPSLSLPPFA
jgi:hypothetical protein